MANKKISELPAAATTTGPELVPIVQGGNTVRATVSGLIPPGTYAGTQTPGTPVTALDTTSPSQSKAGYIHVNNSTVIDPCASPYNAPGIAGSSSHAAITAAIAALPDGGTLEFTRGGVYELSGTQSIVTSKRINWKAKGGLAVLIRKVGTGHGVVIGGASRIDGIEISGIAFASEAGAGDALVLEGVHRSRLDILVPSAAGAGVRMKGCLLNEGRISVAVNNYSYGAQASPVVGLSLEIGQTGTGLGGCNGNRFYVVAEGCTAAPGYGINVDNGDNNVIVGASEGNTIGIRWGAGVHSNVVHLYMEGNAGGNEIGTRGNNTVLNAVGMQASFPFGDGTAAIPTIYFREDPDTGFWRVGAGQVGLSLDGVLRTHWQPGQTLHYTDESPGTTGVYDLGSATRQWRQVFANNLRTGLVGVGFNGAAESGKVTVGAAATDAATTQALVNQLRALLVTFGLAQ